MVDQMEQEYVYHLFLAVKRLNTLLDTHGIELKLDTYYRLLDKMVQSLTIPFEGEPLAGLQVMGGDLSVYGYDALGNPVLHVLATYQGVEGIGGKNDFSRTSHLLDPQSEHAERIFEVIEREGDAVPKEMLPRHYHAFKKIQWHFLYWRTEEMH